jgi:hypothetical protein
MTGESMNESYILAMKDARDFSAKEGLSLEQAGKLSTILDRIDEARRGENQRTKSKLEEAIRMVDKIVQESIRIPR